MANGNSTPATPANLSTLLEQIENDIHRGETFDALGALERAKQFASNSVTRADQAWSE